ncbi:hypothetical protein ACRQ5Q_14595 [Bradyrhizobium sp. PMVTL-01]|uniref:hypothetical protein n=1 Tax=Bradyrhizobium sp. PMVTL-01 TaxID=3434999 RepID=UPI003F728C42
MGWWNRWAIRVMRKRVQTIRDTLDLKLPPQLTIENWRLRMKLDRVEADLKRRIQRELVEICRTVGCDMRSVGGCNAGCDDDCCCSVPVHKCTRCGDCDYGENEEAEQTSEKCAERRSAI